MTYGLGRISAPDERDRTFLMRSVLPPAQALPPYRYFRPGPILDQGSTSSCVGHAWASFLMAAPIMSKSVDPFEVYRGAQDNDEWDGNDYDGSSVRGGAKYLRGLGRLSRYVWSWDAETVADFILSGQGTVVVGTTWTNAMFTPDATGFLHPTGPSVGGHAWLIVGYNRTRGVFRMQNSWSRSWADHGRAWITGEDLQFLLRDGGEACAAVEI